MNKWSLRCFSRRPACYNTDTITLMMLVLLVVCFSRRPACYNTDTAMTISTEEP